MKLIINPSDDLQTFDILLNSNLVSRPSASNKAWDSVERNQLGSESQLNCGGHRIATSIYVFV
jgi:hypothetical protein